MGSKVDIAMLDSVVSPMYSGIASYLSSGQVPGLGHMLLFNRAPHDSVYESRDRKCISVGALECGSNKTRAACWIEMILFPISGAQKSGPR
jgi:crotonobetainyl-CoA:carnitine CoA-transferase CaiB-like acyl-CoA transferase